jgi:hypothetical protein
VASHGFVQSLQTKTERTLYQFRPQMFPAKSFKIHHSLVIQPLEATWSELPIDKGKDKVVAVLN